MSATPNSEPPAPSPHRGEGRVEGPSRWAAIAAVAVLAVALYLVFRRIDEWAGHAFAQARLASMLVAVIDAAVFGVALCLAPVLSRWIAGVGGRRA